MFLESVNATATQGIYNETLCEVVDQNAKSDNIVDLFYSMMLTAMRGKFKKIGNKLKIDFPYNNWFDDDCKQLKTQLKPKHLIIERRSQLQGE